jgi:Tol biopolymer transport system component
MSDLGPLLERDMQEIRPAGYTIADVARRRDRRSRNRRIRAAAVALVITAGVIGGLIEALGRIRSNLPADPGPVSADRIVFVSPGDGGPDDRLYSVTAEGGDLQELTGVHAEYPAWSPDGSMVAFDGGSVIAFRDWSDEPGHIYLMNADGTGLTKVTDGGGAEFSPAWSPDGTGIALSARSLEGSPPGIFILDVATKAMRPVTSNLYSGYLDKEPHFSPDGTQIVFVRDRQLIEAGSTVDRQALFVVNVDGSGLRRLTRWDTAVGTPPGRPTVRRLSFEEASLGERFPSRGSSPSTPTGRT